MFKKLKDKIAEEVKQSPLKIQASVQQLTQAMSPNSNNNSLDDDTVEEQKDLSTDTSNMSEYDSFTTVDLKSPTPPGNRRLSSTSSVTSDPYLSYDFTLNRYSLQSDLESNSEFDDGSSIHQFNNVSKEQLYEKYRLMLQKYHKYRGRFVDIQKYCKELQRENSKAKNVMAETQDKNIRRITELREQCTLEQEAKAHLEEALRNELEEKDHLIKTLNTKIELLRSGKDCDQNSNKSLENTNLGNDTDAASVSEVQNLKNRIKTFETLLGKAKDGLTQKSTQIQELNLKIESDKRQYDENLAKVKEELKSANERIEHLQREMDVMRRKEEDASLSLAENKLAVHKELETKENQIKNLEDKIAEYEKEIKKAKVKRSTEDGNDDIVSITTEEMKTLRDELTKTKTDLEELRELRGSDLTLIKQKDAIIDEFRTTVNSSNQELLKLKTELQNLDLNDKNDASEKDNLIKELEQNRNTIKKLELSLSKKHKELSNVRSEKDVQISDLEETKKQSDEKVTALEKELALVKDELLEKTNWSDKLKADLDTLKSTSKSKESEEKFKVDKIAELENNLRAAKDQYDNLLKDKKTKEEIETNLKADKIVLEEVVKNAQNELKTVQADLQNAKKKITDYEELLSKNENDGHLIIEKEELLNALNSQLENMKIELEKTKEAERNMCEKTASLLEQINDLKSKEDEHLNENRKLKENTKKLKTLENEIKSLNEKLLLKDQEIVELKSFEEELHSLNQKLISKDKSIEELQHYKAEVETLNEKLLSKGQEINDLESFKTEVKSLSEKLSLKEGELKDLQQEVNSLNTELHSKEGEITKLKTLKTEVDSLKEECENKNKIIIELQASKEELNLLNQQINSKNEEIEKLKKHEEESKSLQGKVTSLAEEINRLTELHNKEVESLKEELNSKEAELNENQAHAFSENEKLRSDFKSIEEELESLRKVSKDEIGRLKSENEYFQNTYQEMKSFCDEVEPHLDELNNLRNVNKMLIAKENESYDKSNRLNVELNSLKNENKRLTDQITHLSETLKNAEEKLETVLHTAASNETPNNLDLLTNARSKILDLRSDYVKLQHDVKHDLNKLTQLCCDSKEEICSRASKIIAYETNRYADLENNVKELSNAYETCKNENKALQNDKKELLCEVDNLGKKLNGCDDECQKRMESLEERYEAEIRQITIDYETKLNEKEKEYEALENKLFSRNDKENAFAMQENLHIMKNLQEELTLKHEAYENLYEEKKEILQKFEEEKSDLKKSHDREMKQNDRKWRECLDKKIVDVEEKYKEEINELTTEWSKDRKHHDTESQVEIGEQSELNTVLKGEGFQSSEFLEKSASQSEDADALKKQVQVLFTELNNYKQSQRRDNLNVSGLSSCNSSRSDLTLDDPVSLEHLRNILYKYMMGIETSAAARVLAEIVKFDNEQKQQVLDKAKPKKSSVLEYFGFS